MKITVAEEVTIGKIKHRKEIEPANVIFSKLALEDCWPIPEPLKVR